MHALQQTQRLLQPGGILVDIHDLPVHSSIDVYHDQMVTRVGWLMDRDNFANELSAFHALAQVVVDNHFILEDECTFGYKIYLDDLNELQGWLAEWWTTAYIPQNAIQRINELTQGAGKNSRVAINFSARLTRLRAN